MLNGPPNAFAGSVNIPPTNGPIMNPSPNDAPIIPILPGNCSLVLMSPMYARVTARLPFPAPAKKRTAIAIQRAEASPKEIKNTVLQTSPNIRIGLLPTRSDRAPSNGVNRN